MCMGFDATDDATANGGGFSTYKLADSRSTTFDDARLASIWLGRHV